MACFWRINVYLFMQPINDMTRGAIAGALATVPMTIAFELIFNLLPSHQQHAIGPRRVVNNMLEDLDAEHELPRKHIAALAVASHFGYGAACGAAYQMLMPDLQRQPIAKGITFGLGVWAASYLGWLPAVGWHRSATREPAPRNSVLVIGHIVFGAALGFAAAKFAQHSTPVDTQRWRTPPAREQFTSPRSRPKFVHSAPQKAEFVSNIEF